jgi:hypothetical protein
MRVRIRLYKISDLWYINFPEGLRIVAGETFEQAHRYLWNLLKYGVYQLMSQGKIVRVIVGEPDDC